jgi:acetyl-CoA carboxylase carboxyl transferase subunit alpha
MMLQYSTYSVISPEGCASILWKDAEKAPLAAEAMAITSKHLKDFELIDEIVSEPLGGAHRDPDAVGRSLKQALIRAIDKAQESSLEQLLETRYQRLMAYGVVSR